MRKFMLPLLLLAGGALYAQTADMDAYAHKFFSGAPIGAQNFNTATLEDMLVSKLFLLNLEVLSIEISGGSPRDLIRGYGEELYGECTNYTQRYGRSTPGAAFLALLGSLRTRISEYKPLLERTQIALFAREDLDFALKKAPRFFSAHLYLAQWHLKAPSANGANLMVASDCLNKAWESALQPFQKYQVHVLRALVYRQENKQDLFQTEIDAAAALFPSGRMHAYYAEQK